MTLFAYKADQIFDGTTLLSDHALLVEDGKVLTLQIGTNLPVRAEIIDLGAGILSAGFTDLQVNGGGGVMFNDDPTVATLKVITEAHARLGSTTILPTLITDSLEKTRAAIDAVEHAIAQGILGIAGLHLEGPHLDPRRAGAHLPSLIRPMDQGDLTLLLDAAARLPVLKVTLAPASVTSEQIRHLAQAGVIVSLGHADCTSQQALEAHEAGAICVTHLFNAMSQMTPREPGLVGAALSTDGLQAGLIADLIHVHPDMIRIAQRSKPKTGLFLVSDAMAVAGTDHERFTLNTRTITRQDGRLTLEDGTLAGADLDLARAVSNIVSLGWAPADALAMATSIPAKLIEVGSAFAQGQPADFIHLSADWQLAQVWRKGETLLSHP